MSAKISIIVPVYKAEKYLDRCVSSLINQTNQDIEIILVDDGSPDASGAICDSRAKKDSRIKVIHKKNEGQGIARNAGLDIAEGKYVMFLDSDDYLEESACKRLYEIAESEKADLCCYGYQIEGADGKIINRAKLKGSVYEGKEIADKFVLHFFGDSMEEDDLRGVSACMTLFRRQIIEEHLIRFRSERQFLSEDTIFNLDFCQYVGRAVVVPEYFYHYVQNGDSFSHAYRKDRFELTKVLCDVLEHYSDIYKNQMKTENRIRMVYWVSLMECIKQEMRREDSSLPETYRMIRKMCCDSETKKRIQAMETAGLNGKQKLLVFCVRHRMTVCTMMMAYFRNRKGL